MIRMFFIAILILAASLESQVSVADQVYGKAPTGHGKKIDLADLEATYQTHQGELLELDAKVEQVCQKKGCWMQLKDKHGHVRVRFEGYSFFVPLSLKGQRVKVEGLLKQVTQSVAEQKHFLEDAGADKKALAAISKPLQSFEFEATSVLVESQGSASP